MNFTQIIEQQTFHRKLIVCGAGANPYKGLEANLKGPNFAKMINSFFIVLGPTQLFL